MKKESSNPVTNGRLVHLRGKQYDVVFNLRALAKFRELSGKNLLASFNISDFTEEDYARLFAAGCMTHHPEMTVDAAMNTIDAPALMGSFMRELMAAFTGAQPEPEANPTNPAA